MDTYPIEININIQHVEDLRIKLNGKEYALIPIVDNEEEEHRPDDAPTLAVFVEQLIQDLRREGRVRTSETYHGALASFKKFLQGKDRYQRHRQHPDSQLRTPSERARPHQQFHLLLHARATNHI